MNKENDLEKKLSSKKFFRGFCDGFVFPIRIPYNIGSIESDLENTESIEESLGGLIGSATGTVFGIAQVGLYAWFAYRGYPEVLAIPTSISISNYYKRSK